MGRYTVSGSGADCKSVVVDSGGSTPSLPTIYLSKLVGNREGNLTYQEGNELVYGEPADREFEPHLK